MLHHRSIVIVVLSLALCLGLSLCLGCGDDTASGPDEITLGDAWAAFSDREYGEAVADFHMLVASDSSLAEGYNGLGWCFAFDDQLDSANYYFDAALDIDTALADARAGQSAVHLAIGDYTEAITAAAEGLAVDPEWVFPHDPTIDYRDLHLILAESYFALGEDQYANALQQVRTLYPGSTLSRDDSQTWGGHPTYAAALLKEIEELETIIGADLRL